MQKWEYYTFTTAIRDQNVRADNKIISVVEFLNKLGESGWELVTAFSPEIKGFGDNDIYYYLKRPIP